MLRTPGEAAEPWFDAPSDEGSTREVPNSDFDLGQFFADNNRALVSFVYSWVRSRPDALDIVQEAYCRIFRMDDLRGVGHLRGYLFKTAKNIATDTIRQRQVREAYVQEAPLRDNHESASPEDIWLAREELVALERNVNNLPPKCRLALTMVRIDGASYEDVGCKLGIKTHSARRLVERAMEYLLEKKGPTPARHRRAQRTIESRNGDPTSGGTGIEASQPFLASAS